MGVDEHMPGCCLRMRTTAHDALATMNEQIRRLTQRQSVRRHPLGALRVLDPASIFITDDVTRRSAFGPGGDRCDRMVGELALSTLS
jgi:hypothetical protein